MRSIKYSVPFALLLLFGCSAPSYIFKGPGQTGLDFTQGKWLLQNIDNKYLNEQAVKDFTGFVGTRLGETATAKGLLMVTNIPLQPNKQMLTDLYNGTGYDYYINIKDAVYKDDLAAVEIGGNPLQATSNGVGTSIDIRNNIMRSAASGGVTLEVYDLKNKSIIYAQTVVGNSQKNPNATGDVNFYKPAASLVTGSYNRIIKDIKSKSIIK